MEHSALIISFWYYSLQPIIQCKSHTKSTCIISLLDLVNTNIPDAIQNITVYQLIYKRLETGELFLNLGAFQRMTVGAHFKHWLRIGGFKVFPVPSVFTYWGAAEVVSVRGRWLSLSASDSRSSKVRTQPEGQPKSQRQYIEQNKVRDGVVTGRVWI